MMVKQSQFIVRAALDYKMLDRWHLAGELDGNTEVKSSVCNDLRGCE
jgi:hypothetical protein